MLGPLISAGASLIGGFLGKSSQDKANEIAQQNAANNIALQKEFAQNAIQWKVADAEKAGIHPIYALGGSTTSFAPVSVGVSGANPLADSMSSMGQNVARAAAAYSSPKDRLGAAAQVAQGQELQYNKLKLENMELQNAALRSKVANMNQPGTPPGVAFPVTEDPKVELNPPMMIGGDRVQEDKGWSPAKVAADRWGDESMATNIYGNIRAVRDLYNTYWPQVMQRRASDQEAMLALTKRLFQPNTNPRYRGHSIPR